MKNKILVTVLFFIFLMTISYVKADRISDYEFESGKSNLYVSNRSAQKCVALTFDDGPHPKYTPMILDILEKYNAKATFFVIGKNAKEYPEIIRDEHDRGHEIGNHTYSHPDLRKISAQDFLEEIQKTSQVIFDITGETPKLFRPPGGYLNNDIVKEVLESDSKAVLWSWRQDTKDWSCPNADCIVSGVIENLSDGDIILFHDYNSGNSPTPQALEKILENLSKEGYKFVTVSELMSM